MTCVGQVCSLSSITDEWGRSDTLFEGRVVYQVDTCWIPLDSVFAINPLTGTVVLTLDSFLAGTTYSDSVNFSVSDTFLSNPFFVNYRWHDTTTTDTTYTWAQWVDGIDMLDLIVIYGHVTGDAPITDARQYLAADVNMDGRINKADAELVYDLITRQIELLPSKSSRKTNILCDSTTLSYTNSNVGSDVFVFVSQNSYLLLQDWLDDSDVVEGVYFDDIVSLDTLATSIQCYPLDYPNILWGNGYYTIAVKRGDVNASWRDE